MISKYAIDYVTLPRHKERLRTHHTDDPVEAEEFLMHLLAAGAGIRSIRHEGVDLSSAQSDHMIKVAAERVATLMLRDSLGIDAAEVRHRFGFAG